MSYTIGSKVPVPETAAQLNTLALEIVNLERIVEHGEKRLINLSSRVTETPNIQVRKNLQAGLLNERRRLDSARRTIPQWKKSWEAGDAQIRADSDYDSDSDLSRRSSGESTRSEYSNYTNCTDFMGDLRDMDDIEKRQSDLGVRFLRNSRP